MKKILVIFSLVASLFLTACGTSNNDLIANGKSPDSPKGVSGPVGYITAMEGKSVLIGDIFYAIKGDTSIIDSNGNKRSFSDLEIGMKVHPSHTGQIRESYPAQADAVQLKIVVDEQSQKEQKAVAAMLKDALDRYEKPIIIKKIHFLQEKNAVEMEIFSFTLGSKPKKYIYYFDEAKLEELE